MANIKLVGNNWEAEGIFDKTQNKTQKAINSEVVSKLGGIEAGAQVNRTYTATTGKPTANQTPAFGDTATISQVTQDTTGQISVTDRTIKIPNSTASTSAAGLMSAADKTALDTAVSNIGTMSDMDTTATTLAGGIGELKGSLDSDLYEFQIKDKETEATGWRLNTSNGLRHEDAAYVLKKYAVNAGEVLKINSDDLFQFQNKASVPSSGNNNRVGETYGSGIFELTVPATATYLIVSTTIANSSATVSKRNIKAEQFLCGSMINPGGKGGSVGESILFSFPSGKWLLMDTHVTGYGVYNGADGSFTKALIDRSPTGKVRIDYLFISHYHADHVGGLIDWIDNGYLTNGKIDLSNAVVFLPQELTSANISHIVGDDPTELIARQTKIVNALTAQGCTIIRPTEGQTYVIDDAILRFTNCNHSVYVSGTYKSTNYNDFSLCAYVEYGSQRFFNTADIGPIGQKYLATLNDSLLKSDIMTAPHHGWQSGQTEENGLNPDFIKRIYPNVVLSPNGDVHKPDSGQASSMYNYENVLQTWCEENSVPNYATCLNGTINFYLYYQSWEFDNSYIAYIRNNKNWFYNVEKTFTIIPSHLYLVRKGGFSYIWTLSLTTTTNVTYYTETTTPGITNKIAEFYKLSNWASNRSFSSFGIAKEDSTGGINGNVHAVLLNIQSTSIGVFAKNLQGETINTAISGLFFLE